MGSLMKTGLSFAAICEGSTWDIFAAQEKRLRQANKASGDHTLSPELHLSELDSQQQPNKRLQGDAVKIVT